MEKNPGMLSSKTFLFFQKHFLSKIFIFDWRKKEIHEYLGWHGGE